MIGFKKENGQAYHDRLEREFYKELDSRMRAVKLEQADWMWRIHRVPMIITGINRTWDENMLAGGSVYSAHMDERAVDERTIHLSPNVVGGIVEHLKSTWGDFLYVLSHNSGAGPHIHTNIRYKYRISPKTNRRNV